MDVNHVIDFISRVINVVVYTDFICQEPHKQVGVDNMIASRNLGSEIQ